MKTLIIMAAGLATRYGGGKQTDGLGPNGELLIEYAAKDAVCAGFGRIVCVVRPQDLDLIRARMEALPVETRFAFQSAPEGRKKPWGTVHAVLCAREATEGSPFAVCNADDYYGPGAYRIAADALDRGENAMVGYRLGDTLSENGSVKRGVCEVDNGRLTGITERFDLTPETVTDPDVPVSMNFWAFRPEMFDALQTYFDAFTAEHGADPTAECLLPDFVKSFVQTGGTVFVHKTDEKWFGVTYREDREKARALLANL